MSKLYLFQSIKTNALERTGLIHSTAFFLGGGAISLRWPKLLRRSFQCRCHQHHQPKLSSEGTRLRNDFAGIYFPRFFQVALRASLATLGENLGTSHNVQVSPPLRPGFHQLAKSQARFITAQLYPKMEATKHDRYTSLDYKNLAKKDQAFKAVWIKSSGQLDYQDPETCKALTKATLKVDFGDLKVDLPGDRLCPPIPSRWNYVAWIQGLIDSTAPSYLDQYDPKRQVIGLDIGTGASAIYTLLALKTRPNWTMCATDIDKKSFDSAARNLALNDLITRTKMLQTIETDPIIPIDYLGVEKLDFTICNPPFFNDEEEMRSSLKGEGKSWKPSAVCTGSPNEMIYPGGDSGFVAKMISESLALKERVTWYSSMLGKLSSAKAIIELLKSRGVNNWAVGCLEPGGHTRRWIVAWSFGDLRPRNVSFSPRTWARPIRSSRSL